MTRLHLCTLWLAGALALSACDGDYDCARDCAASELEDAGDVGDVQALVTCMESSGCGISDLECAESSCPSEWRDVEEICG